MSNTKEWTDQDLLDFAHFCGIQGHYNNIGFWIDVHAQTSVTTRDLLNDWKRRQIPQLPSLKPFSHEQ